jgi:hypothetical protein
MGCDITMHVERRVNGEWQHVWAVDQHRSYAFFAMLAGVRNNTLMGRGEDIVPLDDPRGLPFNVTRETAESLGDDEHSHSYASLRELQEYNLDRSFLDARGEATSYRELCEGHFAKLIRGMTPLGAPDDVRIVFAFDC